MVEDHPLDYRTFEGTIPQGNYGAGTVMVWDHGTYGAAGAENRAEGVKLLREGLTKGHLRLDLNGRKLKGEYSLIRLKRGAANSWLLVKKRDEWATTDDVTAEDRSITSGRNLEEIAGGVKQSRPARGRAAKPARASDAALHEAPKGKLSGHVRPMLATLVDQPFDRKGWLFELKWDGYRAVAEVKGDAIALYSRSNKSFGQRYAPVVASLRQWGREAILDGEVVVVDEKGKSSFQLLQNYQKTGQGRLIYYVFDLLHLDGRDLRGLPLRKRKELLAKVLGRTTNVQLSEHVEENGVAFFEAAKARGLEGVVAKDAKSPYREGQRTSDWLKIKTRMRQEAVIGGFTEPRGSRKNLGALVLGVYHGDELIYIGHTGGGFNIKGLADMRSRLQPLVRRTCPFSVKPKTNAPAHWLKPELVCEVSFQEWTHDGIMRQPVFLGLREDKKAKLVRREEAQPVGPVVEEKGAGKRQKERPAPNSEAGGDANPAFTHLDKIYWPDEGYTKGDLIDYYRRVAPALLPYLRDRPESLHRHPNGINGKSFFQKDVSRQPPPDWVKTVAVTSESRRQGDCLCCLPGRSDSSLPGEPRLHRTEPLELAHQRLGQAGLSDHRLGPRGGSLRAGH